MVSGCRPYCVNGRMNKCKSLWIRYIYVTVICQTLDSIDLELKQVFVREVNLLDGVWAMGTEHIL